MISKCFVLLLGNRDDYTPEIFRVNFLENTQNKEQNYFSLLIDDYRNFMQIGIAVSYQNCKQISEKHKSPNLSLIPMHTSTRGALGTIGLALDAIPNNQPLLIAPIDARLDLDLPNFVQKMEKDLVDCGIISFNSSDSIFSFLRVKENSVMEISEKQVISDVAISGFIYFRNKELLISCLEWSIMNNIQNNSLYYLSPALNYFVASNLKIVHHMVQIDCYNRLRIKREN